LFYEPLRSGLRAFGAWRSVGLAANLTLDYHAIAALRRPSRPPWARAAHCAVARRSSPPRGEAAGGGV